MSQFEACRYCVAPKRHPGCHDHCPDYKKDRAKHDERKAAQDRERDIGIAIYQNRSEKVYKALKIGESKKFKEICKMQGKYQRCDMVDPYCTFNCEGCGHNLEEVKQRKNLLEQNGLKLGKDGLLRLILPKKKGSDNGWAALYHSMNPRTKEGVGHG